jgi:hypothetical protein
LTAISFPGRIWNSHLIHFLTSILCIQTKRLGILSLGCATSNDSHAQQDDWAWVHGLGSMGRDWAGGYKTSDVQQDGWLGVVSNRKN